MAPPHLPIAQLHSPLTCQTSERHEKPSLLRHPAPRLSLTLTLLPLPTQSRSPQQLLKMQSLHISVNRSRSIRGHRCRETSQLPSNALHLFQRMRILICSSGTPRITRSTSHRVQPARTAQCRSCSRYLSRPGVQGQNGKATLHLRPKTHRRQETNLKPRNAISPVKETRDSDVARGGLGEWTW